MDVVRAGSRVEHWRDGNHPRLLLTNRSGDLVILLLKEADGLDFRSVTWLRFHWCSRKGGAQDSEAGHGERRRRLNASSPASPVSSKSSWALSAACATWSSIGSGRGSSTTLTPAEAA